MTYRKRFTQDGNESEAEQISLNVTDGVVQEAEFVERFEPDSLHAGERMEEDDDFLAFGTEIWEYDISPGKEKEFQGAVAATGMAIEIEGVDSEEGMPALEGQ